MHTQPVLPQKPGPRDVTAVRETATELVWTRAWPPLRSEGLNYDCLS